MATAKPKTTKIEAPTLEEVVIAEAVEEALIEDVIEEVVEAVIEAIPEALVEEPVESVLEAPQAPVEPATPQEKVPFVGDQRSWHGAQFNQNRMSL